MNVGLCEAGVPILGVVGVPAAEDPRTYFAVKGQGAFVEVMGCFVWAIASFLIHYVLFWYFEVLSFSFSNSTVLLLVHSTCATIEVLYHILAERLPG